MAGNSTSDWEGNAAAGLAADAAASVQGNGEPASAQDMLEQADAFRIDAVSYGRACKAQRAARAEAGSGAGCGDARFPLRVFAERFAGLVVAYALLVLIVFVVAVSATYALGAGASKVLAVPLAVLGMAFAPYVVVAAIVSWVKRGASSVLPKFLSKGRGSAKSQGHEPCDEEPPVPLEEEKR